MSISLTIMILQLGGLLLIYYMSCKNRLVKWTCSIVSDVDENIEVPKMHAKQKIHKNDRFVAIKFFTSEWLCLKHQSH